MAKTERSDKVPSDPMVNDDACPADEKHGRKDGDLPVGRVAFLRPPHHGKPDLSPLNVALADVISVTQAQ